MPNEIKIEPETVRPAEQTPGDHGEVKVRIPDTNMLVDPNVEYRRPSESESEPPKQQERTTIAEDPTDPVPHKQ